MQLSSKWSPLSLSASLVSFHFSSSLSCSSLWNGYNNEHRCTRWLVSVAQLHPPPLCHPHRHPHLPPHKYQSYLTHRVSVLYFSMDGDFKFFGAPDKQQGQHISHFKREKKDKPHLKNTFDFCVSAYWAMSLCVTFTFVWVNFKQSCDSRLPKLEIRHLRTERKCHKCFPSISCPLSQTLSLSLSLSFFHSSFYFFHSLSLVVYFDVRFQYISSWVVPFTRSHRFVLKVTLTSALVHPSKQQSSDFCVATHPLNLISFHTTKWRERERERERESKSKRHNWRQERKELIWKEKKLQREASAKGSLEHTLPNSRTPELCRQSKKGAKEREEERERESNAPAR